MTTRTSYSTSMLYVDILFLSDVPCQVTLEVIPGDSQTGAPLTYDILGIRCNGMSVLPLVEALDPEETAIRRLINNNEKFQQFCAATKEPRL